jgi:hypothetical protein
VHLGESVCCDQDGVDWSCLLLVVLSTLALLAVTAHGCHIFPTFIQMKRADTMHLMPGIPGWAMLWIVGKTAVLSATGMSGLVMPRATSQSWPALFTRTVLTVSEEDLVACSMPGQLAWLTAILVTEICAAGCKSSTPAATPLGS